MAILLILLSDESASSLILQLVERDCELLATEIDKLPAPNCEQQNSVLKEFTEKALSANAALGGSVEYTRAVLDKAVGIDRASHLISRIGGQRTGQAPECLASAITVQQIRDKLQTARANLNRIWAGRSQLELDVDLGPTSITIEVLKQLIFENPIRMGRTAAIWLSEIGENISKMEQAPTSLQKLAALLILLGEDTASVLFKNFEEHEHEAVAQAMSKLPPLSLEQQTTVLKDFTELAPLKEFEARFHGPPAKPALLRKEDESEEAHAARVKLVMDFGLGEMAPERITIEVLKQLIRENPLKVSQAARIWLQHERQVIE